LNRHSRFGCFVSALKIPFPGNGDFGSKRRGSNAGSLSGKAEQIGIGRTPATVQRSGQAPVVINLDWKRRNLRARGIQGCHSIPAADTIAEVATTSSTNHTNHLHESTFGIWNVHEHHGRNRIPFDYAGVQPDVC
jgi:hypothetical protein